MLTNPDAGAYARPHFRTSSSPRATDESVPGPFRNVQSVRHIVSRVVVTRHRGRSGPCEVIMQRAPQPFVTVKADIFQRLIETGDCPLIHLFVRPVTTVNPHDRRFITVPVGVG